VSIGLVWFRRDLRLHDNPALSAALRAHEQVLCAYIHAPDEEAPWAPGAASRWWLHHSLAALDAQLRQRGAALHLRGGPTQRELDALLRATGAEAVYWNRLYEPAIVARDTRIKQHLLARGVHAHSFNASLLEEPWQTLNTQDTPYKVFTPYWRRRRAALEPRPPLSAPRRIAARECPDGVALEALRLLPTIAWDEGLHSSWTPGEAGARARLRQFLASGVQHYAQGRDVPAHDYTSQLSPHLHFGEIGPRQIVWALLGGAHEPLPEQARETFLRELGWREFAHYLLYHFPRSAEHNFDERFDAFTWARRNAALLRRWQRGRTGIPIVDAGMRQLWHTGWMHNRVRMLVASWLTKNLRQHWLEGARRFWDTLVDADLANNTLGWQWTAGTSADAAPYFRIFNPVTQGERFDADGAYVRRWVAELADVPAPLVHQPWRDPALLRRVKYPAPMVEPGASRGAALAAFQKMRTAAG